MVEPIAVEITQKVKCPTIGIGASAQCDGQVLVAEDMLGRPGLNWQVGNAKFFSPVGPDETLTFTLTPKPSGAIAFMVRATDRDVAAGSLTPPAP